MEFDDFQGQARSHTLDPHEMTWNTPPQTKGI
jgi:hypothetical protein